MRRREHEAGAAREPHEQPDRRPGPAQVEPLRAVRDERRLDEHAVAVLRAAGPGAVRLVPAFARRPEEPVLLERVDDLLEPDEVRLEGRHVREQQRQALLPAVGEVADVERRDEQAVHDQLPSWVARRADGQRDGERRPGALLRLDADRPAVPLDDVPGDREAEPGAAAARPGTVDLVEALEDPAAIPTGDPDPVVDDRDLHAPVGLADPHDDVAAVRAELHRVVDEVDDHLAEPLGVPTKMREVGRDVRDQGHAVPLGEQAQPVRGCRRERADVDVVLEAQLGAALDARQVQHLVDHLGEVPGLLLDPDDPVLHPGRQVGGLRLAAQASRRAA